MAKSIRRYLGVAAMMAMATGALADPEPVAPTTPAAVTTDPAPAAAPALARAPEFACEGTSGQTRRLADYIGRAVIVMYEDRDSNHQNDTLKTELAARARAQDLSRDVSLVPVANLSQYNFWPAMGFARDAVVDIAREQQTEILIDWSGDMARAYRFRPGVSYVLVLTRDGRVLFRHAGTLNANARGRFFNAITEAMTAP